ncbi:MAG: SDR family oxidoreductase [Oligoflexia bacterium]|nr:SDR family oxidoreductase [Oligoflexia bacterium]
MKAFENRNWWALILGGSSGFGLATAKALALEGMHICVVHRDRRGALERIEREFAEIRGAGVQLKTYNLDALDAAVRTNLLDTLKAELGSGTIRLMLHSIALGSVRPLARPITTKSDAVPVLAAELGLKPEILQTKINELFTKGEDALHALVQTTGGADDLVLDDEELARTVQAMGTSLYSWARGVWERGLFTADARVIGLTSEGNQIAWYGYAAVSAAKAALEAMSRSIAREFGAYGIRSNIIQAGVTDTPALRLIPGHQKLMARARIRNPLGRLTETEDVARVIALLCRDEAAWINGSLIRVDGGECISG